MNPCGRIVDILRSCYRASMRFYHDSEMETPVEWYFVPDDRETVPFAHSFASRLYERDDEPQPPIGERYNPVPWRGGAPPAISPAGGLCGSEEQWRNGASVTDPLPTFWPGTSIGKCCHQPGAVFFGGVREGGVVTNPVVSLCCEDEVLPEDVVAQFTILFLFCTPIDAPIPMHRSDEQPPQYTQTTKYVSDSFTFADAPARLWLACEETTGDWGFWLLPDDGIGFYGQGTFTEKVCDPFRMFCTGDFFPGGSWTDCLVFDSSLEVLPA